MSDPNTLRILSIDGGGERGYLSLKFFQRFIQQWGIAPTDIWKNFDVICGTSIGGIAALAYAYGMTPDELEPFFLNQGPYIFSLSSLVPSLRPNLAAKVALVLANTPFYQSSGPTENSYGYGLLKTTLQTQFGTDTLQNLKTNVIIPSFRADTNTYVLFSNLNYSAFIGQNELISNVALATSSAPVYFPSADFGEHNNIDGGVYQNNPADLGRILAQVIKPIPRRICVLSLGTGIGEYGFDPDQPSLFSDLKKLKNIQHENLVRTTSLNSFNKQNLEAEIFKSAKFQKALQYVIGNAEDAPTAIEYLFKLFNIASTGGQESVANTLLLESLYTLNQLYYYRFQPQLDTTLDTEVDNTDPAILSYYETTANTWYNNDIDNISTFIGHLTA